MIRSMNRSTRIAVALVALSSVLAIVAFWASRDEARATRSLVDDANIAGLPIGARVHMVGSLTSRFDGTRFDAASRTDLMPDGSTHTRLPGFFDLEAGGLEVAEHNVEQHDVILRVRNAASPACAAIGRAAPCLVPRIADLARERLLTESEFRSTLTGAMRLADVSTIETRAPLLSWSAFMGSAALLGLAGTIAIRAQRGSVESATRRLARLARERTKSDPTLASVHASVTDLVTQADGLERAGKTARDVLAAIDGKNEALLRERAADASAHQDLRAAATRELTEIDRLRADVRAADAGVERVHAALRTIALAARTDRGVRVATQGDAAADAFEALTIRDEAASEVETDSPQHRV